MWNNDNMLSFAQQNHIIFTPNSRKILVKNPWWLRHLGFFTRIFLWFVVNIYGSASRISAYCPNLRHLGFFTRIFLSFVVNIYGSASRISAYCPIFAEYSVFSRILGIQQNIWFRQSIRPLESAEYSVSADSENLGFCRSLVRTVTAANSDL